MKNKKVKQMICSVLNRNGGEFGYYSLVESCFTGNYIQGSYSLREFGRPFTLSRAVKSCLIKN
ncbi:hypothetical protein VPHPS15B6_0013 [Vibrio phage PS15B-6]